LNNSNQFCTQIPEEHKHSCPFNGGMLHPKRGVTNTSKQIFLNHDYACVICRIYSNCQLPSLFRLHNYMCVDKWS